MNFKNKGSICIEVYKGMYYPETLNKGDIKGNKEEQRTLSAQTGPGLHLCSVPSSLQHVTKCWSTCIKINWWAGDVAQW